ncbi:MAG: sensor histidine kinase [Anaerolineales bacterium]|nr:sensor histidine kinase [Anaerolineales bacterium]
MNAAGLIATVRMRLSRLSLFQRIVIGNAMIIVFGAVIGTLITRHLAQQAADWWLITLFATGGILLILIINFWIVGAALKPLRDLGRLAKRLQSGDATIQLKNPDPYTTRMAETLRSLFLQLEERNRELQALSERAINAQEEERRAIAQSLHDDTGQALSMLIIHLDRIDERIQPRQKELKKQVTDARALASNSLTELRRILSGLRPAILDDLGLVPAIRWFARANLEQVGIHVVVKAPSVPLELSPAMTTTLFRIVQEAVSNIVRHAGARSVTIILQLNGGSVNLHVEDDGRGFDPSHASRDAVELQKLGLLGIRERAELLGGEVQVESAPERGTRLQVSIPLGETGGENPYPAG